MGERPAVLALSLRAVANAPGDVPASEFLDWLSEEHVQVLTGCEPNALGYQLLARRDVMKRVAALSS